MGRAWELGTDGRPWVPRVSGCATCACNKEVRAPMRQTDRLACWLLLVRMAHSSL